MVKDLRGETPKGPVYERKNNSIKYCQSIRRIRTEKSPLSFSKKNYFCPKCEKFL